MQAANQKNLQTGQIKQENGVLKSPDNSKDECTGSDCAEFAASYAQVSDIEKNIHGGVDDAVTVDKLAGESARMFIGRSEHKAVVFDLGAVSYFQKKYSP